MSRRRNYWVWTIALWVGTAGLTASILLLFLQLPAFRGGQIWMGTLILTSATVFTTLGIGNMRMFGYRLTKAVKKAP